MNKIAQYLNEHILGEVSSLKTIRRRFSQDASVLSINPEIVMFPKVTNDIRKVARFTWQLAEKGHVLGLTARGGGTDTTGASIGKGIVINTSAHLNAIIHIGIKDKRAHAQAGANLRALNDALSWQGLKLINTPESMDHATVGGAIANNASGAKGTIGQSIEKLEVILANGDVIETSRISKREVSKKKGLQTLEGEIYRKLDGLIEDNDELIKRLANDPTPDHTGYHNIAAVKAKDGSFDLTPLFVGSQGTLGIISEAVLKTDFYSKEQSVVVGFVETKEIGRDITDSLRGLDPTVLEMIDGELYADALEKGTRYSALGEIQDTISSGAIVYIAFDDFSDHARVHKLKKVTKLFDKAKIPAVSSEQVGLDELIALRSVASNIALNVTDSESMPPVIDGAFIPTLQHGEFVKRLAEISTKLHIDLPIKTNILTGAVALYPTLKLGEVSEKQKIFRLMTEYGTLVDTLGGAFVSEDGEGRLKSNTAWSLLDDATADLFTQVREVFDPFGTLNPGVKQKNDIKHLVEALRSTYDFADLVDRGFER